MVTDEHGAYRRKKNRQSDHVHHLRFAEDPVYVWLTMFGEFAEEAGIGPQAEFRRVEAAVVPPLVDMIKSSPGVRHVDGVVLPPSSRWAAAEMPRPTPHRPPPPPPLPPPSPSPSPAAHLPRRARRTLR